MVRVCDSFEVEVGVSSKVDLKELGEIFRVAGPEAKLFIVSVDLLREIVKRMSFFLFFMEACFDCDHR